MKRKVRMRLDFFGAEADFSASLLLGGGLYP
jgi:hypothetical protein